MTDAELLPLIYEAPLLPGGWDRAVQGIKESFDSDLAILTLRTPGENASGITASSDGFEEAIDGWLPALETSFDQAMERRALHAVFRRDLTDDDDLIESIEKELDYETLLSEKGKLDLEKLFKENSDIGTHN